MKRDIVQEVTNRIVASLEDFLLIPWLKPWDGDAGYRSGYPISAQSGKEYRGINRLLLMMAGESDPRWITYKQAQKMGGNVRKGERGTPIVFWQFVNKTKDEENKFAFCKQYTVFNVAQCENLNIEPLEIKPMAENPGTVADELATKNNICVERKGDSAYFSPARDKIVIPALEAFESESAYASTLLHEMTHWTGHASRLDRTFGKRFGDQAYAFEELVAELGSAFLCAALGVEGKLQHANYISGWLDIMKSDKHAVFTAAREAQKAMDLLLGSEEGK